VHFPLKRNAPDLESCLSLSLSVYSTLGHGEENEIDRYDRVFIG